MDHAYFRLSHEDEHGGRYVATEHTVGPWDRRLQHGGPPSALLTRAAERCAAAQTARSDLHAARLAVEFLGPVPVGEVDVSARVLRAARSAVLVEARLSADERECLHARVWLVAQRETAELAAPPASANPPTEHLPGLPNWFPYADSIEWREAHGSFTTAGPGAVWARVHLPLIEDTPMSALTRAALLGDSASGVSSALDWSQWSFANIDLEVHLARPLHGDWLYLDAATQLGPHGYALARSTLSDVHGPVGATAQTLVLAPLAQERPAD